MIYEVVIIKSDYDKGKIKYIHHIEYFYALVILYNRCKRLKIDIKSLFFLKNHHPCNVLVQSSREEVMLGLDIVPAVS